MTCIPGHSRFSSRAVRSLGTRLLAVYISAPFPVGGASAAVVYYNRNGSVDIQVLRNVLPEKSASRLHSVALQENSDVEIPCAVHWFVIYSYITTFVSRTILAHNAARR